RVPLGRRADAVRRRGGSAGPGTGRDRSAVIERAAIRGDGSRREAPQSLGATEPCRPAPLPPPAAGGALLGLDEAMARHIEAALTQTHGRIEGPDGAAALLGINPHTPRARMRKLGVDWKRFRPARRRAEETPRP